MPFSRRTSLAIPVVALVAAMGAIASPAAQAAVFDPYTGSDPSTTGCSNTGITVASWPVPSVTNGQSLATAELRYSTACQTNWVRVTLGGSGGTGTVVKTITRPRTLLPQGGALEFFTQTEVDPMSYLTSWGMQVYAPGHTCVIANATLKNASGAVVGTTGDKWVC